MSNNLKAALFTILVFVFLALNILYIFALDRIGEHYHRRGLFLIFALLPIPGLGFYRIYQIILEFLDKNKSAKEE